MSQPAARQGDLVTTNCNHQVKGQPPGAPLPPPVVAQLPHPFTAIIDQNLSTNVKIGGKFVALKGSKGKAQAHPPLPPPGTAPLGYVNPPNNEFEIMEGSGSVNIEGKPVARIGDKVKTCSEIPPPHGVIAAGVGVPGNVFIGG
ncbi:PAAR domain-containing protein [Limnofasciculus baicalensis]|uniref:PAAR domain-containing protein n=1 Tax=Limnofasciculus baicalensis BBK-W-15 TaxID=2699891 RepID=A0AAE3KS93_9CYAN|nr:PAAR domain-containing protein [Limnofasciculus baicalensis]MCP2729242.1 PAAR domain-containing protein [Limnofasciculus baicalensis BBK-W-15]